MLVQTARRNGSEFVFIPIVSRNVPPQHKEIVRGHGWEYDPSPPVDAEDPPEVKAEELERERLRQLYLPSPSPIPDRPRRMRTHRTRSITHISATPEHMIRRIRDVAVRDMSRSRSRSPDSTHRHSRRNTYRSASSHPTEAPAFREPTPPNSPSLSSRGDAQERMDDILFSDTMGQGAGRTLRRTS